jgi:hypothetical protein
MKRKLLKLALILVPFPSMSLFWMLMRAPQEKFAPLLILLSILILWITFVLADSLEKMAEKKHRGYPLIDEPLRSFDGETITIWKIYGSQFPQHILFENRGIMRYAVLHSSIGASIEEGKLYRIEITDEGSTRFIDVIHDHRTKLAFSKVGL